MTADTYCVDTSALFDGLERYYPPTIFPQLWDRLDSELVDQGRFIVSEEVYREACAKDLPAKEWCEARREQLVVPTDADIANRVAGILQAHPAWQIGGRNGADPFVIAVAQARGAVVVSGEAGGTVNRPKIPSVCRRMGVRCVTFLDMVKAEGWSFPSA